ncbi:hypothetical protein Tco_1232907, partial [Tanacetum coccineum]
NEIENDDLGYHSEEYFDDAHEDDENNHSNGNVVKRGITRALFLSFLGDMVREHIGLHILFWKKVGPEARNKLWDEITVKYAKAKMARSKCVFPHIMGRGGYAHVKEKMKETEDKIKEDQGTDAVTFVLGKENGGYARGVGSGVIYKWYFDLPRSKQAADESILLLESQLDAARREREEKELLIKSMSSKMSQTEGMVTKLKNQFAAQGGQLQSTPTQLTPLDVSPVEIHPINRSADEEGGTTVLGCDQNDASIRKEMQTRRKNFYVSSDAMQKEANKKRSQKALVY